MQLEHIKNKFVPIALLTFEPEIDEFESFLLEGEYWAQYRSDKVNPNYLYGFNKILYSLATRISQGNTAILCNDDIVDVNKHLEHLSMSFEAGQYHGSAPPRCPS